MTYAHVIVETNDQHMDVLNGAGFDGEKCFAGNLNCRYGGEHNGRLSFEIAAAKAGTTLAGSSLTIENFVELEGEFNKDDWVGIGIETGGIQILEFAEGNGAPSAKLDLRSQIKRQVLNRGIILDNDGSGHHGIRLTARRFFMKRWLDTNENSPGGQNACDP